ncbi:hypothetical protein J4448_04695 [Candidatus Woesearchaeota archaeon]|nr:hypothetical protein [Candidatus Woesearchaeota archaeon]
MSHESLDSLARKYAKGGYHAFHSQENLPKGKRSSVEDDPTIPWRYAVSYAFSLGTLRPELAKTILGEDAYKSYQRLMKDKTPGIPEELVPHTARIKMYDGVKRKQRKFAYWKPEKKQNI